MGNTHDGDVTLRRIAAFFLDHLVILVYLVALAALALLANHLGMGDWATGTLDSPGKRQAAGLFLVTLPWVMYHATWEASPFAATPGKRAVGLRVIGAGSRPVSMERAVVRSTLKFLPWELTHTVLWRTPGWPGGVETIPLATTAALTLVWLLMAGYLATATAQGGRQTMYDLVAGTEVSKAGAPLRRSARSPFVSSAMEPTPGVGGRR